MMTNSKELFQDIVNRITLPESDGEIRSIVYLILEKAAGITMTDIIGEKSIPFKNQEEINDIVKRINHHEPLQYILGETEFLGRIFKVNPSVLIPRPETELLVHELIRYTKTKIGPLRIVDIGTGSGCIAISLAQEFPESEIYGIDVSEEALICAQKNAENLNARVSFKRHDILLEPLSDKFDLIVSNPPYIDWGEKKEMQKNVLDYEPHLALFAPEGNPLAFYKAIAHQSRHALLPDGSVWLEINFRYGNEVKQLFEYMGFRSVQILKDLDNKDRIVFARL